MGSVDFGDWIDEDEALEAELRDTFYTGEVPPGRRIYRAELKIMTLGKTGENAQRPGSPLLKVMLSHKAPRKDHADFKYNGYGTWEQFNISQKGAPFINALLNAIVDYDEIEYEKIKKAFYKGGLVTEDENEGHVVRIGDKEINSPSTGIYVYYYAVRKKAQDGEPKLAIGRFLKPENEEDVEDYDDLEDLPDDLAGEEWSTDDHSGYEPDPVAELGEPVGDAAPGEVPSQDSDEDDTKLF